MKFLLALWLMLAFSVQAAFVPGTDVPLMDGLVVDENEGFSFDTPEGQIMTIVATSDASAKEITSFYQESLSALGWKTMAVNQYRRDQDELMLKITSAAGKTVLKLQLTFANK